MRWFDAGVNLLDSRFDPESVIANAVEAGVSRLCAITTHPDEWCKAKALYQRYPDYLCYTVGCHPHHAKVMTEAHFSELESHLRSPGVVAVGECGLDFNRDFSPRVVQETVFRRQLTIAMKWNKPVYLHERDAFDKQIQCLDTVDLHKIGGISHCFTADQRTMSAYLERGLYIGITGWLCDPKRGDSLREAVKSLPLDKLILETDAPYLFPKNRRPRTRNNEPAFLPDIGGYCADLLELSSDCLAQKSYANACRLFRIAD